MEGVWVHGPAVSEGPNPILQVRFPTAGSRGRNDGAPFRICPAHALPAPPVGMTRFDGPEDQGKEEWLEARLRPLPSLGVRSERPKYRWNMPMQSCAARDLRWEKSKFSSAIRATEETHPKTSWHWHGSATADYCRWAKVAVLA